MYDRNRQPANGRDLFLADQIFARGANRITHFVKRHRQPPQFVVRLYRNAIIVVAPGHFSRRAIQSFTGSGTPVGP